MFIKISDNGYINSDHIVTLESPQGFTVRVTFADGAVLYYVIDQEYWDTFWECVRNQK